ncbi:MAG TPA: Fe-S cluster assembly protein SufD [Stellaceae bacterium]|nr:Fe-S cluster assembly protein SufD [Stellaceae bacterium]
MSAVLDFPVKPEARPYVGRFAEAAREPEWLRQSRRRGLSRFAELGFPSRKSESWRYLDLRRLEAEPLLPAVGDATATLPPGLFPDCCAARLVLAGGRFAGPLSRLDVPPGVWFGSIARAIAERPDLIRAAVAGADAEHSFAALNGAFFADGFVLDMAACSRLDRPAAIIHWSEGSAASLHTRSLVNLAADSRATIVEIHAGKGRYWRNDVVLARLGERAELRRIVIVEEAGEAAHFGQFDATLGAGARCEEFVLLLGGSRVRHEANIRLAGEGAHCDIDGAFVVGGDDEANIVTAIDHAAPGGRTRELIKGVAAGRGHGAFQGKITVREHAQKTDAHQLSRNLIIGRRAAIDTKPELEILADDVKCSHGASVGELDAAALFYLQARGIPAEEARHMLIEGFLAETVEPVSEPEIRAHLLRRLTARLGTLEG